MKSIWYIYISINYSMINGVCSLTTKKNVSLRLTNYSKSLNNFQVCKIKI